MDKIDSLVIPELPENERKAYIRALEDIYDVMYGVGFSSCGHDYVEVHAKLCGKLEDLIGPREGFFGYGIIEFGVIDKRDATDEELKEWDETI